MTLRILTVDLEGDLDTKSTVSIEKVLPKLLDLLDNRKISATFFVVSELLEVHSGRIKEIQSRGHEIASHSKSHSFLNSQNSLMEMQKSKKQFEDAGIKVTGFRAPGYVTANSHFEDLKNSRYSYDSSLAVFFPDRYRNFWLGFRPMSFIETIKSPDTDAIKIIELPIPTFFWPIINSGLTYLKLFYPLSLMFRMQYLFYLHPWEFLDYSDLPSTKKTLFGRLLSRNNGKKAWKVFEKFLDKAEKKNTEWVTCSDYIKRNKLGD